MSAPEPDFSSVSEADAAYYGDSDGDGTPDNQDPAPNDPDQGARQWGKLQEKPTDWVAGWTLAFQEAMQDASLRRWFVIRVNQNDQFQALTMSGTAKDFSTDTALSKLPHTENEQEALEAYQTWVEENQGDTSDGGSSQWTKWTKIQQVGDWWIWGREHKQEDRRQFLAAGKRQDGATIYLQPDGSPSTERHIYDSAEALQKALDAYAKKKQAGQIPEDEQPTGKAPTSGEINRGRGGGALPGPLGAAVQAVGGPRNAVLIGVAGAGGLYYAEAKGYIDVTEAIPQ